jgi:ribosomal protein S18 acetylase RimI-like enzyme
VLVRPLDPAEAPAVLRLWTEARDMAPSVPDEVSLAALLEHDPAALLVAEQDGRIVGSLIAAWDGWRGNMYRLAVAPGARREGIALALVRAGEERLRARGAGRVTALVAIDDLPAVRLWNAAGYRLDEAMGRFVKTL